MEFRIIDKNTGKIAESECFRLNCNGQLFKGNSDVTDDYYVSFFTGKKDKNGNKIYCGDILTNGIVYQDVYWCEKSASFRCNEGEKKGWSFHGMANLLEVVGNIF